MTPPRYERPQIKRHGHNLGNDFGAARARAALEQIDGAPVADLVREHGSPLFVFSERSLRARARELKAAFASRWPRLFPAWSYKTNHLDAICSVLHQEGWGAEVVSAAEYAMARRLGVPGDRIVFNGACKPIEACRRAAAEGAFVQIDHFDEIEVLEEVARERGAPLKVGLRLSMAIPGLPTWDRFGFHLDNGEAKEALRRVIDGGRLEVVGVHAHLGTYVNLPEAYGKAAERLIGFAGQVERATGRPIEVVNAGGGFPSRNSVAGVYGTGPDSVHPLEEFAERICAPLRAAFGSRARPPVLVLESGRALVEEAGTLIATVVGVRRTPTGERGLVLDAGVNLLYTSAWFRHEALPTEVVPGELETSVLYGPLCMRIDVVRSSVSLPPLEAGQHLALRDVGAYNVTQWMQFSQMRPAVVMVGEGGGVDVIRRAEVIEDLKVVERLPERLATPVVVPGLLPTQVGAAGDPGEGAPG